MGLSFIQDKGQGLLWKNWGGDEGGLACGEFFGREQTPGQGSQSRVGPGSCPNSGACEEGVVALVTREVTLQQHAFFQK